VKERVTLEIVCEKPDGSFTIFGANLKWEVVHLMIEAWSANYGMMYTFFSSAS
jgi:hypothetical protein